MPKPILVANWKNHPSSRQEASTLLKEFSKKSDLYKKLTFLIAPPLPYLDLCFSKSGKLFRPASQDFPLLGKGSYTGEVTSDILKSFGTRAAIVGHSERRAMGEKDETVALKVRAALRAGVTPIVCVGESKRDHEGEYFEFLRTQIKNSLSGLNKNNAAQIILAYEPVWAIGKSANEALKPSDLEEALIFIRKVLTDLFGRATAEKIHILYGGSVEPRNAEALAEVSGVRGFLVGHVSLTPKNFHSIAQALL
jgi:triosephosphate isomerase (TIM)